MQAAGLPAEDEDAAQTGIIGSGWVRPHPHPAFAVLGRVQRIVRNPCLVGRVEFAGGDLMHNARAGGIGSVDFRASAEEPEPVMRVSERHDWPAGLCDVAVHNPEHARPFGMTGDGHLFIPQPPETGNGPIGHPGDGLRRSVFWEIARQILLRPLLAVETIKRVGPSVAVSPQDAVAILHAVHQVRRLLRERRTKPWQAQHAQRARQNGQAHGIHQE